METNKKPILVVDDESTIREVVRKYLEAEGFLVIEASDGFTALDAISEQPPSLIILDLMLPGIDGLTITRQLRLRAGEQIPIIMLTARNTTNDRIRGLDLGADDYLVKPFSPRELISRVNAVLRRTEKSYSQSDPKLTFGDLIIDPAAHEVTIGDRQINLSSKEFELLFLFASNPKIVFTRSQLLDKIWGMEYSGDPSTVTVHIRRLREKIEPDPSNPIYLATIWGVGYKFDP